MLSEEKVKLCFLVTFNMIINYVFSENFIEIHQVSQKIRIFTSSVLTIFVNFWGYFSLLLKNTDVSIYEIISAVF